MPAIEADTLVDELLHTAEGRRNPYLVYHRLREIAPVYPLDPLAEREGGDIFEELAFPLSVNVIGELLGDPEADRPQFRTIARDTTLVFEARPTPEQLEAADRAQLASRAHFSSVIEEKRRRPVAAPRTVCPHARAASSAAESFQHTLAKDARL